MRGLNGRLPSPFISRDLAPDPGILPHIGGSGQHRCP
jgi:hypothetical protein